MSSTPKTRPISLETARKLAVYKQGLHRRTAPSVFQFSHLLELTIINSIPTPSNLRCALLTPVSRLAEGFTD